MAITVSSTVVAVGAFAHDEIVYWPVALGENLYQMLRETIVWHEGNGGSPTIVASVMSAVTLVVNGKGPAAGITSALAHRSFAGATCGVVPTGASAAAAS